MLAVVALAEVVGFVVEVVRIGKVLIGVSKIVQAGMLPQTDHHLQEMWMK